MHHLLIGLGLNPRQAALMLYCFSGFLCGAVMLGVALRSEFLALVLGISGCLAFLLVVTSRRDELSNLRGDLQDRMARGRQERQAAKLTWEAIQRIELCDSSTAAFEIVERTAGLLGCDLIQISCTSPDSPLCRDDPRRGPRPGGSGGRAVGAGGDLSTLRWRGALDHGPGRPWPRSWTLAADIVFRYLQRLGQALAGRLEWFQAIEPNTSETWILRRGAEPRRAADHGGLARAAEVPGVAGVVSRALG